MKLEPKYYVLDELLRRRLFRIPNYQRTYSWKKKQRNDLFDDIKLLHSKNQGSHHFMATVVCLSQNIKEEVGAEEYERMDVVDGQQRLTTLIILLKSIAKGLNSSDKQEKELKKSIESLLVKEDQSLILLQTNHDSGNIFADYLRTGKILSEKQIQTQADLHLREAFLECEQFSQKWKKEKKSLISLIKLLNNRLGFIFYVLDNEGIVYTVFEVLNARGLEVDWLDKCKSMLMGIIYDKFENKVAKDHQNEVHSIWSEIYSILGKKQIPGHEILGIASTLLQKHEVSRTLSAQDSFDFLKSYCYEEPNKILEVTKWILTVTKTLGKLYSNRRLSAVTNIAHARLLALSIMQANFNSEVIKELLEAWEKVTFTVFGLYGKDSRTAVGDYVRISYRIYNKKLKTKSDILDELKLISDSHPIEQAVKEIQKSDCYNQWEECLRYFLYRYEEYLCELQGSKISEEIWEQIWQKSPSNSIEHIHPQVRTDDWKGKLGKGRNTLENNVHRIGNLILLPPNINSECGRKSFKKKKEIYKKNFLRMHEEVIKCIDWNKKRIDEREKKLIEFAINTWSI